MMYDVERNIVYGMYSGLALLMDVYRPEAPNGIGLIHICGSGFRAPLSLDARPLKESVHVELEGIPLVEAGYTLFTINHRAVPRFHFPDAVHDAQRAVRFVRYHASDYGVAPDRLGAVGGSSGGHLVCMLGVLPGCGDVDSDSEIDRLSASVQAVVARAPVVDFLTFRPGEFAPFLNVYSSPEAAGTAEHSIAREASPLHQVHKSTCPFLLIHGTADSTIPFEASERFVVALRDSGTEVDFVPVPGADHGPGLPGAADDFAMVDHSRPFLDRHLLA
jgi:acetyl esterase/lipase